MTTLIEPLLPSVHDTLSLREALSKIAQCERHLKSQGLFSIIDNFNIIYSCYCCIKELKTETIEEIVGMLIKGIQMLEGELKRALADKLSNEERVNYLKTLKILTFLIVEFSNFLEKKFISGKENELLPQSRKGAAKKTGAASKKTNAANLEISQSGINLDWADLREKVLETLSKLLVLNIQKLWDPPIAEEQFVIMITNLCYKFMENMQTASLRPQQKKQLKEHLCHILGLMIKKYNHSYGACVTIVQTLPHCEHYSALYADLIQTCVAQLGYESILPDLLRELRHANLSGVGGGAGATAGADKFYSQFIIELADRLASHLTPYLSLIQELLDEESYLMRNAILYTYGEIIIKVLKKEAASPDADLKVKQTRNELLDILIEHIHDVNGLTRSKTLQIWRRICEEKAIPLNYISELMKRCVGRMEDVASTVRKSAFQLLCDLIRHNPFGIKIIELEKEQIQREYDKEEETLRHLVDENDKLVEQLDELVVNAGTQSSEASTNNRKKQPRSSLSTTSGEEEEDEEMPEEAADKTVLDAAVANNDVEMEARKQKQAEQIFIQKSKVNYLKDTLLFITEIDAAIPKLSKMLFSKTQTDVLEVISFFVTCYKHGFTDMLAGIRKMLALMLTGEKTIKEAVTDAYKELYLDRESSHVEKAKKLLKLVQDVTVCEREALAELIGEFAKTGLLPNEIVQILWEIYSTADQQPKHRLGAVILLGMVIKKLPNRGKANIQVLVDSGLTLNDQQQPVTDYDILRFSETCLVLSYLSPDVSSKHLTQIDTNTQQKKAPETKKRGGKENNAANESTIATDAQQPKLVFYTEPYKIENGETPFDRLMDGLVSQFSNTNTIYWTSMAESALHCVFKLADQPFDIIEKIVGRLIEKLPAIKALTVLGTPAAATQSTQRTDDEFDLDQCSFALLARFINLIGLIATKLLVFMNQMVVCELKRRKMIKESKSNIATSKSKKSDNQPNAKKRKSMRKSMGVGDQALEEEMGLAGAEAEDAELMLVEQIIEQKIASSTHSLLAQITPAIVCMIREPGTFSDESLQLACALSLVRIMMLSKRMCEEHIQLLFTLMEKSPNPAIRSQLIVGIGDLVYRFPNSLERWTTHLYLPLRDTRSELVRLNTLRVLSHLILKELIKTRGQIYEIALCTIDPEPQIAALAKLFFQELAQINNGIVIYNLMPDIISHLSDNGSGEAIQSTQAKNGGGLAAREITEESFRTVVTYLFTFIKRDKQCETLIEKLCTSFRTANVGERKCRDLAFCLSKVQLSDSGIKKLKECFKCYADKLYIQLVYDTFKNTILKNARKVATRDEVRHIIDELEKQIDEVKQKGIEVDQ